MKALTRLSALVAAVTVALTSYSPVTALAIPERFQVVIRIVGWQPEDVPMLAAVVECESGWQTFALGQAGELGLMQLMPSTYDHVARLDEQLPARDNWSEWSPSVQLYAGKVLHTEQGWTPWVCAWPYLPE